MHRKSRIYKTNSLRSPLQVSADLAFIDTFTGGATEEDKAQTLSKTSHTASETLQSCTQALFLNLRRQIMHAVCKPDSTVCKWSSFFFSSADFVLHIVAFLTLMRSYISVFRRRPKISQCNAPSEHKWQLYGQIILFRVCYLLCKSKEKYPTPEAEAAELSRAVSGSMEREKKVSKVFALRGQKP